MPMIDVYATEGTLSNTHQLAQDLANAVMRWEAVPPLALFRNNTAAFIHELPASSISNTAGDSNYIRVQVLTPVNVLDRDKQLGVVERAHRDRDRRFGRPEPSRSHVGPRLPNLPKAGGASRGTPTRAPTSFRQRATNSRAAPPTS